MGEKERRGLRAAFATTGDSKDLALTRRHQRREKRGGSICYLVEKSNPALFWLGRATYPEGGTPKRKEKTQLGAFKAAPLHRGSAQWGFRGDVKAPVAEDQARCPVFGAEMLPGSCYHLVPRPKVAVLPSTVPESITA